MSGDPQRARRAYAPLVAAADETGWQPGLAARVAQLHYMCGEYESALDVLDRCADVPEPATDGQDAEDIVDWWASRVHVLDVLGRTEDAQRAAQSCLDRAERHGQARALGVAHLAAARTCRGTLKDLHHDHALRFATQADDVGTSTRTLADRTYVLMSSARYDQACVAAREAARMARLACPPGLQAAVLHNLGEALARTGRARRGALAPRVLDRPVPEAGSGPGGAGSGRDGRHPPGAGAPGAESRRLHRGRRARPRVR